MASTALLDVSSHGRKTTSLKNIEFSILAIVNRCNRVTRTMAYLEIKKRSEFYYLGSAEKVRAKVKIVI